MKRLPDRVKQRREYLKQKGKAYSTMAVGSMLFVPVGLITLFLALRTLVGLLLIVSGRDVPPNALLVVVSSVLVTLGFGGITRGCWRCAKRASQQAAHLPYVPPVTSDALPAEEVLVRGSEEPIQAQSEVLVRPATGEEETQAQELLRSSQQ